MTYIKQHRLNLNYNKICPICSKRFYSKDLRIKYCSKSCSEISHNLQVITNNHKYKQNGYFNNYRKQNNNKIKEYERNYYRKNKILIREKQNKKYLQNNSKSNCIVCNKLITRKKARKYCSLECYFLNKTLQIKYQI